MGRNKNEHLEGLLVQKNQEIAALETQLKAYIARTSILQSRLLSTLDALDVIQSGQNKELDTMTQTNKRLKDKLYRYIAVVKSAELERDDMRDAVLKLVEKVELSNDYSMWPHSQIRLSSLAGGSMFQNTPIQTSESDLLFHATTMIETLRRERDLEREAHARTRDWAQAQILSLEAQLSRREAELENFISGTGHTTPIIQHEHPRNSDQLVDEPLASVMSALDPTVARKEALETEIRSLFKRLENARRAASSSNLDRPPPLPSSDLQRRRETLQSLTTGTQMHHNTASQKVQSPSITEAPQRQTICERSRTNDVDQTLVLSDPNSLDNQAIEYLEDQIKTLGAMIDAFVEARRSITQTLQMGVHRESALETSFDSLDSDNHRLKLSERDQSNELDTALFSVQDQDNEPLERLQLNQQAVLEEPNDVDSLLEPDNGEMSMELATPLLPTRMMPDVNTHVTSHDPYVDGQLIPLPPSPDDHPTPNSPALSQIILPDSNSHHAHPDSAVNEMESLIQTLHPP